jgi:predicted DNA-binding ArsR family transcriptional regulator
MQQGAQPFNGTNSAMAQGTYQNDVTNTVSVVIPRDAETTNKVAQPLANGAVVVMVLESKSKGADGNSAFEIIGLDGGLVATASTSDVSGDAGKNYVFTLTETTSNLAMFLNAGSYNSTKLLVEGLIKQS